MANQNPYQAQYAPTDLQAGVLPLTGLEVAHFVQNGQSVKLLVVQIAGAGRKQRSITATPIIFESDDQILNVNLPQPGGNSTAPLASSRNGSPLTFKMLPGSAVLTLHRSGLDTFDGQTFVNLVAGDTFTIVPYNDGVNTGYSIQ